jgi:hypothetical protein
MTIATAFLLTVVCGGTQPAFQQAAPPTPIPASEPAGAARQADRQGTSGIIIAADIDGRVAIYDGERRLVVDLDKPAGRQLQVALDPGAYEARLGSRGTKRARFQLGDGQQMLLAAANFREPEDEAEAPHAAAAGHGHSHHARPIDGRHRIEVRFGGWGDGSFDEHGDDWLYSGSAQGAFGLEYLNFVRNDLGVGLAITTLARADGGWHDWEDGGTGRAICSIPVVARWYPVRRLTTTRAVEPYLTAGIGPVFGVDAAYQYDHDGGDWDGHDDHWSSGHVGTAFGGRVGGGVDFRLGHVFTIGVGGAWNWDTGFSGSMWDGARPGGGEFTVAFGWNFGR